MQDYQSGVRVVDQVLLIKKINSIGESIIVNSPDSDEAILYIDSNGSLKIKNTDGSFIVSSGKKLTNIQELKDFDVSRLSNDDVLEVLGYYSSGDDGGGFFRYDSESSADDDGGCIIAPSQGGGRWIRLTDSKEWSVKWFGAKGDGVTNDTIAINKAVSSLSSSGGGTLIFPTSNYAVARRVTGSQAPSILLKSGVGIDGKGSTLIQTDNASTLGTDPDTTARATITANVSTGATTLTVNSSASLSVGQTVGVRLGDNPWDSVETSCFYYAKIIAIPNGTSITLDTPAPQNMVVADTESHNKKIIRFDASNPLYENQSIKNINFDQGPGEGAVVESAVYLYHSRGINLNNISLRHPGAGLTMAYGLHNSVFNINVPESIAQGGQGSKGRGINLWNCVRCVFENIKISKFQGAALFIESFCKGIIIENASLDNNWLASAGTARGTTSIAIINQGSEVSLDGVTITGKGSGEEFISDGGAPAQITFRDIDLATTEKIKGGLDLSSWTGGFIRFGSDGETIYHSQITEKTITVPLSNNMAGSPSVDAPPVGYLISGHYFCPNVSGLDGIYQTRSLTSSLLVPSVSNASTAFFSGNYGTDYTFNTPEASGLAFYTTTVVAGAFITLRFRYAPVSDASVLPTGSGAIVAGVVRTDSIQGKAGSLSILGNIVTQLPTSSSGLASGSLWNDGGTVKIVT